MQEDLPKFMILKVIHKALRENVYELMWDFQTKLIFDKNNLIG